MHCANIRNKLVVLTKIGFDHNCKLYVISTTVINNSECCCVAKNI